MRLFEVLVIGLEALQVCHMHAKWLPFCIRLLVHKKTVKLAAKILCMFCLDKAEEAKADINALLDVKRQVKKVKQPVKSAGFHFLQKHELRELPRNLAHHDCHHCVVPGHWISAGVAPAITAHDLHRRGSCHCSTSLTAWSWLARAL